MNNFFLYGHGGCENHGCEAIVRSTVDIIKSEYPDSKFKLLMQSQNSGIDAEIKLPVEEILLQERINKVSAKYLMAGAEHVLLKKNDIYFKTLYKNALKKIPGSDIALSIGGDNYCYGKHNSLYFLDKFMDKNAVKRVLWGCSVEPELLRDTDLVEDLDGFRLIIAREPITFNALKKHLKKADVILRPDPAFALKTEKIRLSEDFTKNGVVGVNISSLVSNSYDKIDITYENYDQMIENIIKTTHYNILLIPHVTWKKSNDLIPLGRLYEKYRNTGRIFLIEKFNNCCELKGYISQCDMFIGARTHSTIAAYSSCVPCIAVGYSVKATGIATQLFGKAGNYVIDSKKIKDTSVLTESFKWLDNNKIQIKEHLSSIMPGYIAGVHEMAKELKSI